MMIFKIIFFFILFGGFNTNEASIADIRNEDENFWRTVATNQLKKIINYDATKDMKIKAKNIIIFIGDGMGMTSITAGRIFKGQQNKKKYGEEENLVFDQFPNVGLSKTYNVDKQVPDSAGTATALFSGVKTRYGVIGMDNTTTPSSSTRGKLTSIMDWALSVGKRTGLVTTTRITHATPAALYANVYDRDWECDSVIPNSSRGIYKDIARQLVEDSPGKRLNVILAGGRSPMGSPSPDEDVLDTIKFSGKTETVCSRTDGRNLVEEWLELEPISENGKRKYVKNRKELLEANAGDIDHLLGLFAHNHITYSVGRPKNQPTLLEMTRQAIKVLQRPNTNGFVLTVEGGRIDQAHHQNYAQAALTELLEFDEAIGEAIKATNRSETLIIVTADHSHAMTLNGYPNRGNDILGFANKPDEEAYETLSYANGPGYWDHMMNETEDNTNLSLIINGSYPTRRPWINMKMVDHMTRQSPTYRHTASFPLKDETHGGEDIPVYATGPGSNLVRGVFEQNYIAYVMSYAGCMGPAMHMNKFCQYNEYNIIETEETNSTNNYVEHKIIENKTSSVAATNIFNCEKLLFIVSLRLYFTLLNYTL